MRARRAAVATVLAAALVVAGCSGSGGNPGIVASGTGSGVSGPAGGTGSAGTTGPATTASRTTSGPSGPATSGAATSSRAPTRPASATSGGRPGARPPATITSWVYQLQNYPDGRLDALVRAPHQLVVIDLARDASTGYFTAAEIARLHAAGKSVLAYFEIGSIEDFRPEYAPLRREAGDLVLNRWEDWPNEYFVRYWEQRWWDRVVRPRVDQALRAGFDGVYLDTPLAYEELDLALVPGWSRDRLGAAMVALIVRLSSYAKARRPGFWVFPQNSPELRRYPGYTRAIDGIGMEELFVQATDSPCTQDYCAENLAETRALRAAGKLVLAVDYAAAPGRVAATCSRYRAEGFVGYVADLDLDGIRSPCS